MRTLAFMLLMSAACYAEPLKIMCIGDSITYGKDQERPSYRWFLQQYFDGIAEWVGPISNQPAGFGLIGNHASFGGLAYANFTDYEGNAVTTGLVADWDITDCDAIFSMLGVNDIFSNATWYDNSWDPIDFARLIADVEALWDVVDAMRDARGGNLLHLVGRPPLIKPETPNPSGNGAIIGDEVNAGLTDLNNEIYASIWYHPQTFPVDIKSQIPQHLLLDNVHPNKEGDEAIARLWAWTFMAVARWQPELFPDFVMADLNLNGQVDYQDLIILAQNYGRTSTLDVVVKYIEGDLDGDGDVDFQDYLIFDENF